MKQRQLLQALVSIALACTMLLTTAQAGSTTWLPAYSSGQHIYIAPDTDSTIRSSFEPNAMQSQISALAAEQDLDVYVVITSTASDYRGNPRGAGPALVRQLWSNWTSAGFNSPRSLVILLTGQPGAPLSSTGVRAGEWLNNLGINRDTMNDEHGPVRPVLQSYLGSSYQPVEVTLAIVKNISELVAKLQPVKTVQPVQPAQTDGLSTVPDSQSRPVAPSINDNLSTQQGITMTLTIAIIAGALFIALLVSIAVIGKRKPQTSANNFEDKLRQSSAKRNTTVAKSSPVVLTKATPTRKGNTGNTNTNSDSSAYVPIVDSTSSNAAASTTTHSPASSCSSPASSCSNASCGGGSSCGGSGCGGGGCGS